jgi:hypothetical protein
MSTTTSQLHAIDWSTATVERGNVAVALTGSPSKEWRERFGGVMRLLSHSTATWGEVRVSKRGIDVSDVQRGSESDLRHFLESIVVQVNAELAPTGERSDAPQRDDGPQQTADREMADALRAFAGDSATSAGSGG